MIENRMVNYEEPKEVICHTCSWCGSEIIEEQIYYKLPDDINVCVDCMRECKKFAHLDEK